MAAYAGTAAIFQVNAAATAGNLGGGGFNPANTHFLTNYTATVATGNAPVIASAGYNFVSGDVGAWVYVKSGTNWTPGFYQISSVASNAATVNATIGAAVQFINGRYQANTVAGCATTASPTSGTCGIDYSQGTSARFTATTGSGTTTAFTDATNVPTVAWVGNFLCLATGTGLTPQFYECVSFSGTTITLDRTAGTAYSAVTYYLGGAVSLGGSTTGITDALFALNNGAGSTTGCTTFVKGPATYTPSSATSLAIGSSTWPNFWEGFTSIRGDRPSIASGNQPLFSMGANIFTVPEYTQLICLNYTGTGTSVVSLGATAFCSMINCKVTNTSTAAARNAILLGGVSSVIGCEAISYNGTAILFAGQCGCFGSYIHDSAIGANLAGTLNTFVNNIVASCTTESVVSQSNTNFIYGNTLYGSENKMGIGIAQPYPNGVIVNNIMYGFVSGYGGSDTEYIGFADYNCFFNNTNNIAAATTGAYLGTHDLTTTNPSFTSVAQVTGTTAMSSGTTLTDAGKNFTTAGVVAGRDYLYVISGTGQTNGVYGITAVGTTTLTTDNTIGTNSTGDLTYQITTGRNFLPTGAL